MRPGELVAMIVQNRNTGVKGKVEGAFFRLAFRASLSFAGAGFLLRLFVGACGCRQAHPAKVAQDGATSDRVISAGELRCGPVVLGRLDRWGRLSLQGRPPLHFLL